VLYHLPDEIKLGKNLAKIINDDIVNAFIQFNEMHLQKVKNFSLFRVFNILKSSF
jgi:hypothetical protein